MIFVAAWLSIHEFLIIIYHPLPFNFSEVAPPPPPLTSSTAYAWNYGTVQLQLDIYTRVTTSHNAYQLEINYGVTQTTRISLQY